MTIELTEEERIRNEFADVPVMIEIARCESTFRQFHEDGTVVHGIVDADDTGAYQINKRYHLKSALAMNIDLDTLDGNMKYARWLYETQGTAPWNASKKCWKER